LLKKIEKSCFFGAKFKKSLRNSKSSHPYFRAL